MKGNSHKLVIVAVILVLALSEGVSAEEELKVKGITVYSIQRVFPTWLDQSLNSEDFDDILNRLDDCGPVCYGMGPSYSMISKNETILQSIFFNINQSYQNKCEKFDNSDYVPALNSPALYCEDNELKFGYDGYWWVGKIELPDKNFTSFSEITKKIYFAEDNLSDGFERFFNTGEFTSPVWENIKIIYIREVYPYNLSSLENTEKCLNQPVSINSTYNEIFGELNRDKESNSITNVKIVCSKNSTNDLVFVYYISTSPNFVKDKKIVIIKNVDAGNQAAEINSLLKLIDYLRYGELVKNYADNIKKDSNSLLLEMRDVKLELLNKTRIGLDWNERLNNLKYLRNQSLDKKENKTSNLYLGVNKIQIFNEALEKFYSPSSNRWDLARALLFVNETQTYMATTSKSNDETIKNLDDIKSLQTDIQQIYYGELGAALNEQAIYNSEQSSEKAINESRNMSLSASCLAIAAILISIIGLYDIKNHYKFGIFLIFMILLISILSIVNLLSPQMYLGIFILVALGLILISILFVMMPFFLDLTKRKAKKKSSLERGSK